MKLIQIPIWIILYFFAFIMVLLTRFLRPIILIRFGKINSYIFGHFVFDVEYHLSQKKIEIKNH